jgi:hypothetical protein
MNAQCGIFFGKGELERETRKIVVWRVENDDDNTIEQRYRLCFEKSLRLSAN